jgi:hypothetical protein
MMEEGGWHLGWWSDVIALLASLGLARGENQFQAKARRADRRTASAPPRAVR